MTLIIPRGFDSPHIVQLFLVAGDLQGVFELISVGVEWHLRYKQILILLLSARIVDGSCWLN